MTSNVQNVFKNNKVLINSAINLNARFRRVFKSFWLEVHQTIAGWQGGQQQKNLPEWLNNQNQAEPFFFQIINAQQVGW